MMVLDTKNPNLEEIRVLMAKVFNMPVTELPKRSTPDNTKKWDSLSHLALIAALEDRYGILIPHHDAVTLLGDIEIVDYLVKKKWNVSMFNAKSFSRRG